MLARVVVVGHRRVDPVVGRQHEEVVGPQAMSHRPTAASISVSARAATGVVAVAVELVGLDEVREHQPGVELVDQVPCRREGLRVRRAAVGDVDADPGEEVADLADGVDRDPGRLQRVEVRRARRPDREVLAPRGARERPGGPVNGRATTRPTACSPVMDLARGGAGGQEVGLGEDVVVGGQLQHGVHGGVEDHLAGPQVVGAQLIEDGHAVGRAVAAEPQAGGRTQTGQDVVGGAVRVARERLGGDDAHELPVAHRGVLAGPERVQAAAEHRDAAPAGRRGAGGSGRARGRRARGAAGRPRPRRHGRGCRRPRRRRPRRRGARRRRRHRGRRRRRGGSSARARVPQAQRPEERRDHLAPTRSACAGSTTASTTSSAP